MTGVQTCALPIYDKRGFRSEAKQLPSTFWVDHGIQELKHYNFFRYRNSDFFFARFVILTESTTDAQVIEKLLNQSPTNKLYYISIVNLDGVKNIVDIEVHQDFQYNNSEQSFTLII